MAVAFGLSSAEAATLNLQLDPDRRLVAAGQEQEVVVKIDVNSEAEARPNRLPLNIAVVIDHSDQWPEQKSRRQSRQQCS